MEKEVIQLNHPLHKLRMARSEIFEFDVLLNFTGASIGRCSIVPKSFLRVNVNQHVCAIRLINKTEVVHILYSHF